jgi:hypothetical protein
MVIAETLFCDFGIGENTKEGEQGNLSDEIAREIIKALDRAGFSIVKQPE